MPARPHPRARFIAVLTALSMFLGAPLARADLLQDLLGPDRGASLAAAPEYRPPAVAILGAAASATANPGGPQLDKLTTTPVTSFESNVAGRRIGFDVATAGDVNGDGFSDMVALGVSFVGQTTFYLFFGGPTGFSLAPGFPVTNLPSFASMARGVGDLDGNGMGDVAIGFPTSVNGSFRVYFGKNGTLDMANPFIESSAALNGFGAVVAPAGDLNADGLDDLVVGSPLAENLGFYCGLGSSGRVDVYFGALNTGPSPSNHWEVAGCLQTGNDTEFGAAVGTAGDVNGDGIDDLVIGAPAARRTMTPFNSAGRVFILHGSASGLPMHPTIAGQGALIGATVLESFADFSRFGAAAITAGDVNGDGFADLAVGSPDEDFGSTNTGFIRVFAGSSTGIQSGTVLYQGIGDPNQRLGQRIFPAGDVNGDGRADLLVGQSAKVYLLTSTGTALAYTGTFITSATSEISFCAAGDATGDGLGDVIVGDPAVANPELNEGRVDLYAGRGDGPSLGPNWSISTNVTEANMGWSVASAGDVNGDGLEDILMGAVTLPNIAAPGESNNGGVFLNYGAIAGPTPGFTDWGFVGLPGDQLGIDVASAGDINGDGFGDIMAGAHQPGVGAGKVRIWYGRSAHLSNGVAPDVTIPAPDPHSQFGTVITSGDFNGDGYSDIAVGAPTADLTGPTVSEAGAVYVYLGSSTGMDTTPDFVRFGSFAFDHLGSSIAGGGDVNGDGYCDLIIGVPDADDSATDGGRVEVWIGRSGTPPLVAGTGRFNVTPGIRFGHHVAYAGDVNGDGFSDVIVGMPFANGLTGRVLVYTGAPTGTWISFAPLWTQDGFQAGSAFGSAVSSAGDVDGDGLSDVLIGSVFETAGGQSESGAARVFLGPLPNAAAPKWFTASPLAGAHFGHALANAGDVNGDGWSDLIVGSPAYSQTLFHQGHADLYLGAGAIGRVEFTLPSRNDGRKIALRGLADPSSFRMSQIVLSAAGRTKVRMHWRVQLPPFFPASATPIVGNQNLFTPTGNPGSLGSAAVLFQTIGGLASGGPYAWQTRAQTRSIYFPTTRWLSPTRNGAKEYDLRSPGTWLAVGDEPGSSDAALQLAAPWPNPMSGRSSVTFDLPRAGAVSLEVLDLQGRRVRSLVHGARAAGRQQASWDGRDEGGRPLGAGVYLYRLAIDGATKTRRVVLIR